MPNQITQTEVQNSHIIRVIGVGGGGSNAVNYMFNQGISGVDFIVCNTDLQALEVSPVPYKIQLGVELTKGRGAGAKPDVAKKAALENEAELRKALEGSEMVFITAGMGGGTGTGAAPVIAAIAKEMGILTVGIVTKPFKFEGKPKKVRAQKGIDELRKHCDTVIEILNDRLRDIYSNLSMREAFAKADIILSQSALGIAEGIEETGLVNIDFEDVRTAISNSGSAVMGIGTDNGNERAIKVVDQALSSPLLNDVNIQDSKYILLIIRAKDMDCLQMEELEEMTDYLQSQSGEDTEVIWAATARENLGDNLSVTIIATGFDSQSPQAPSPPKRKKTHQPPPPPKQPAEEIPVKVTNEKDIEVKPDQEDEDDFSGGGDWDKLDSDVADDEDFKDKQNVPAYKRRGRKSKD